MKRRKLSLLLKNNTKQTILWYLPTPSKNEQKVATFLENGQEYFRKHFIEETMDLTIKEFLEIIDVFEIVEEWQTNEQKREN